MEAGAPPEETTPEKQSDNSSAPEEQQHDWQKWRVRVGERFYDLQRRPSSSSVWVKEGEKLELPSHVDRGPQQSCSAIIKPAPAKKKPVRNSTTKKSGARVPRAERIPGETQVIKNGKRQLWCSHKQWCNYDSFSHSRGTCDLHLAQSIHRKKRKTALCCAQLSSATAPSGDDSPPDTDWIDLLSSDIDEEVHDPLQNVLVMWQQQRGQQRREVFRMLQEIVESSLVVKAAAHYLLALCLFEGRGTKQDHNAAVAHIQQASQSGYAHAEFILGCCHYFGVALPRNIYAAHQLFASAASKGHTGVAVVQPSPLPHLELRLQLHASFIGGPNANTFTRSFPCGCQKDVTCPCPCGSNCKCIFDGICRCLSHNQC
eukprot:TRINITY_DN8862_c0_g1_i6.p1 TRINITY_DN8862_c0_g1~~TRINITY_DN8862_c0_g1_i6.p1  ORF type:complete len:372 (+),score=28.15 TRINITY_DN8862_c0_g1_i6:186-1301(+)